MDILVAGLLLTRAGGMLLSSQSSFELPAILIWSSDHLLLLAPFRSLWKKTNEDIGTDYKSPPQAISMDEDMRAFGRLLAVGFPVMWQHGCCGGKTMPPHPTSGGGNVGRFLYCYPEPQRL